MKKFFAWGLMLLSISMFAYGCGETKTKPKAGETKAPAAGAAEEKKATEEAKPAEEKPAEPAPAEPAK